MTEFHKDKPQPAQAPYYGLHIWIPQAAGGRSTFTGTNGQQIFIDPIADVVIVHMANSPDAVFNGNNHLYPLRNAIVKSYPACSRGRLQALTTGKSASRVV